VGELATAEVDTAIDFVAVLDEFAGLTSLGLKVVLSNDRGQLNLFDLSDMLILLRGFLLFLLLETVFPIVEDLANWGLRIRSDAE
jgi:hypothetical protein